jgi:HK97 gp10 family phage protein
MAGEVVRIEGLDNLKRKLAEVPKAMRKRVLRNALAAGAREVRDVAKRNAPVMTLGTSLKAPYRKPGTVKQAIRVRTSKADRRAGDVGVFVNVRPAKSGQRGAKNPNDPFYWRFLEFGTKKMPARPFLQRATSALPKALTIFQERIAKWIQETDRSGQVNP